jgi:hypothetical protein
MEIDMSERIEEKVLYAVISGDLVKSRNLSLEKQRYAINLLKSISEEINAVFPGTIIGKAEIFRGDGWQILLREPNLMLRVGLYYRCRLKAEGIDTRLGMAVGTVENLLPDNLSESFGEAFTRSGHALDSMGKKQYMVLETSNDEPHFKNTVVLLDCLVKHWTKSQARSVCGVLLNKTQERIADEMQTSQQSVAKILAAADWDVFKKIFK